MFISVIPSFQGAEFTWLFPGNSIEGKPTHLKAFCSYKLRIKKYSLAH